MQPAAADPQAGVRAEKPAGPELFYKLTGRIEAEGRPELFYPAARPMLPPSDYDLAAEVQKHDVLLSYPYQSIRPFIAMLKKAAHDPDVISIKMTLYRMARESQIVQALTEAAETARKSWPWWSCAPALTSRTTSTGPSSWKAQAARSSTV